MIITFVGHGFLCDTAEIFEKVKREIEKNITQNDKIIFYCGGIGDFDNVCAKACFCIKHQIQNCEVILITPYLNKVNNGLSYDEIIYPPIENAPLRFAINQRNKWMIDRADLIIAFVNREYGGAYTTLNYAKRKNKRIINLADNVKI